MVFALAGDSTITKFFCIVLAMVFEIRAQSYAKKSNYTLIYTKKNVISPELGCFLVFSSHRTHDNPEEKQTNNGQNAGVHAPAQDVNEAFVIG